MKLVKFSVTNFRSILKAQNIEISDTTVLVGKNNEGKSNLLKALSVAMEMIRYHARFHGSRSNYTTGYYSNRINHRRTGTLFPVKARPTLPKYPFRLSSDGLYKWERDFPVSKISGKTEKKTIFELEFNLDPQEVEEFKQQIGSGLNGILSLKITINIYGRYRIEVVKKGKGSRTLNSKANKITRYISERISFNYIPAVRTHTEITKAIGTLLDHELSSFEGDSNYSDYKAALETINKIEKRAISRLSKKIKKPLSVFLPKIKTVKINVPEHSGRIRYRTDFNVEIDDGTLTGIEQKGDGVQSLAALGLLKNSARKTGASIIAIDEPESHLHPGAIHQLQKIIKSLKDDNQIVLTTHNPLFVNRNSIKSNIIVDGGKANPAKDIMTIRDILGVKVSDNLTNARFVLAVEGIYDKLSLEAILPTLSSKIRAALENNELAIYPIGGAAKLQYHLSVLELHGCLYRVFFDHDKEAKRKINDAIKDESLNSTDYTYSVCSGMKQAEFEDCIDPNIYRSEVLKKFKVELDFTGISDENSKWSDRVGQCFLKTGKELDKKTKQDIKKFIVSCIEMNPSNALCKSKGKIIKEQLVKELEDLLDTE